MSRKKNRKRGYPKQATLHPDTKTSVFAVVSIGAAIILVLAAFSKGGPVGNAVFNILQKLLGWGYYLIPTILLLIGLNILTNLRRAVDGLVFIGAGFFICAGLGIIDIIYPQKAGFLGKFLGELEVLFGYSATLVVCFTILIIAVIITLNVPISLKIKLPRLEKQPKEEKTPKIIMPEGLEPTQQKEPKESQTEREDRKTKEQKEEGLQIQEGEFSQHTKDYVFPPLKLLKFSSEKPTVGDLRANANIIKRTLEGFGIPVEMGEITIGPKVTRYTLKPAEGVKLSRITALGQDLSLALAAHPIRIEAPIPGKSLVGIEIPNKVGSIVRLGSLVGYPEFNKSGRLSFPLGRDVSGEPILVDLSKMPHLLVAGATGSGKSVAIHSLILSFLYKNSPETLRLILVDPKRVELSVYDGIPHLITPVITDGKKTIAALRFAIQEMENRYETLLHAGKRDISSYNKERRSELMPYLVIIIDELADLMASHGRDVEAAIVRLAQMARATGIHLVVSTQRPSVEVITGLIKANITARLAMQVASQVDSRTILDTAGAEKLLGGGDMLFVSSDLSKPKRVQGSYISDDEINSVVQFVKRQRVEKPENHLEEELTETLEHNKFQDFLDEDVEDKLYDEALDVIKQAKKASASLLQRRLRIGYARAARLLDIMEDRGVVGPADGAKPREVFTKDNNEEGE
jgi:S-DNA-T family DNA segregation ATPase FtsK/SpoIIIE